MIDYCVASLLVTQPAVVIHCWGLSVSEIKIYELIYKKYLISLIYSFHYHFIYFYHNYYFILIDLC